MPSRFVLQPNGKLGYFSTIVDTFTHFDLTKDEAIEVAREHMGRLDAEAKVERGFKDEIPWKVGVFGDGTARWKDSLGTIEMVHGKEKREEFERLGSLVESIPAAPSDIIEDDEVACAGSADPK
jgi:hypothetical protein